MPYIGNPPAERFTSFAYQDLTGGSGTSFTLDNAVGNPQEIEVFVNNVRQEPGVAYTVSGTALTMTGSIATTDDFYVVFQGKAIQTATHPSDRALTATDGTFTGTVDINGNELILDADADTSITADTDDRIDFKTGGTDRVHISSTGVAGLGIGTTDPDPTSDGTAARAFLAVQGSSNRGCLALGTTSNSGGDVAALRFNNGSNVVSSIGVDSDSGSTSAGSMNFFTSGSQRMKITSGGLVGIGTTNPSIQFEVVGNVVANYLGSFHNDGDDANRYVLRLAGGSDSGSGTSYLVGLQDGDFNSVGSITHSGGNASFNTSSDYRLKENVVDMTGAIARVKSLAPKRFNFIKNPDITVDGFIAHEAQTVVPGAVSGTHNGVETWSQQEIDDGHAPDGTSAGDNKLDGDGNTIPVMQGIDQSKLVPLLVGALKESITKIETLETENATQATQIADLITRVTALEDV